MQYKRLLYILAATSFLLLSYSIFFIASDDIVVPLTSEDGLFETAGALFFFLSAVVFFATFAKNRRKTSLFRIKNIVFLLLGFAFLFAALEEISWGQRLFDIPTPQFLQEINEQGELNIHNISMFHPIDESGERKLISIERLFAIFWLGYCCFLPLLYKLNNRAKRILDRVDFPVVPIFIGAFFALNYLFSKLVASQITSISHNHVAEIKECNFAFLFFILSIWFIRNSVIKLPRKFGSVRARELLHK